MVWDDRMINYSIDTERRRDIIIALAFAALLMNPFVKGFVEESLASYGIAFSVSASAFFLFVILYLLFDHLFWRFPIINKYHGIPFIEGQWTCIIEVGNTTNTNDNHKLEKLKTIARVKQSFSKVSIEIEDKDGNIISSNLTSAALNINGLTKPCLRYTYDTKKTRAPSGRIDRFEGVQELTYNHDDTLSGNFFSNDRSSGSITLSDKQSMNPISAWIKKNVILEKPKPGIQRSP